MESILKNMKTNLNSKTMIEDTMIVNSIINDNMHVTFFKSHFEL
jgi:hypothetical protein